MKGASRNADAETFHETANGNWISRGKFCANVFRPLGTGAYVMNNVKPATMIGISKNASDFLTCDGLLAKKHMTKTIKSAICVGSEPIKAIVTEKRIASTSATGSGIYLLWFTIDNKGNGNSKSRNATVENDEPVGVKLTALAKSNGRKIPKKDKSVNTATTDALPSKTYTNVLICDSFLRWLTVTKYNNI